MADTLEQLAHMYEADAVVCHSPNDVRRHLQANRGRKSKRHKDCTYTLKDMAVMSALPAGTVAKAESAPDRVSLSTLKALALSRGQRVAVVFYSQGEVSGGNATETR